jgi:hypothetical protein
MQPPRAAPRGREHASRRHAYSLRWNIRAAACDNVRNQALAAYPDRALRADLSGLTCEYPVWWLNILSHIVCRAA